VRTVTGEFIGALVAAAPAVRNGCECAPAP
jgi:hypothetical protein